jgi:hypothetical protein
MKEPFDLIKQDKKLPYKVPENYFKELPEKISSQILQKPQILAWPFQPVHKWALASLAVIITFGVLFWNYYLTSSPHDATSLLAEIPSENIIAYLEDQDINSFEFYTNLDFSEEDWNEIFYEEFENFEELPDDEIPEEDMELYF